MLVSQVSRQNNLRILQSRLQTRVYTSIEFHSYCLLTAMVWCAGILIFYVKMQGRVYDVVTGPMHEAHLINRKDKGHPEERPCMSLYPGC